ncbi:VanW family protein [Bacillus massilinigeriensis]|uniref:VanW family protein n=1 Tax=Bacillus mediterraneensis TaxID=1805474 RepID=UPI0009F17CA1|nr:VanW family protein [Bacillus mediterraneensis]
MAHTRIVCFLLLLFTAAGEASASTPPFIEPDSITIRFANETVAIVSKEELTFPASSLTFANQEKIEELAKKMEKYAFKPPKNAYFAENESIVPEQHGTVLDNLMFKSAFLQSFYSAEVSSFELPVKPLYAKVDSELLNDIRSVLIGQYSTRFNLGNRERSHNIELAAKAIDSKVLFPGESFSFNKVVGQRTPARGYKSAPVIIKGELSEGVGGGICQVSSTLFNAVDNSGLTVVRRFKHSKEVPYVPLGRDAAVSWAGPDFVFRNNYQQPVLIRAKTIAGNVIVQVFSSDRIVKKK